MTRFPGIVLYFLLVCHLSGAAAVAQQWHRVKWVNDGDTIVLTNGKSVRYIGINSTEIDYENKTAEAFGYAAKKINASMVAQGKIRLEFDVEQSDRYGRLLAYIFLEDGTFVNSHLLEEGVAYYYFKKPNLKYHRVLLRSQREAMRSKKGIWQKWKEKKDSYMANNKSKRFHLSTCTFGKKIKRKNRVYFSTKWDAFQAGFAPARKCQPAFTIPSD